MQRPSVDRLVDPLPAHARVRLGTAGFHVGDAVTQILYSGDGKTLITHSSTRTVGVWDAVTGRLRYQLALSGPLWYRIGLSPDGKTLATTESNPERRLRLWDVTSGRERRRLHPARGDSCEYPAFSPDRRTMITLGYHYDEATKQAQQYIELWDLAASNEHRRRIVGNWGRLWSFRISPDCKTLAVISEWAPSEREAKARKMRCQEPAELTWSGLWISRRAKYGSPSASRD